MTPRCLGACALALTACEFVPSGPPTGAGGVDAGGVLSTWRDDSADDFRVPGGVLEAAAVEDRGAIAPAAYHVGGLLAQLRNDRSGVDDPLVTAWGDVIGGGGVGAGFAAPRLEGNPLGVRHDQLEDWTYWLEGEVWLDAGQHGFALRADDAGFVDVALPGTTDFTRVVTARYTRDGAASFPAPRAGWYPVRIALWQGGGDVRVDLRVKGPGDGEAIALPGHRLRVRVDRLRGAVHAGWDGTHLYGTPQQTLFTDDLVDRDFGLTVPADLGITTDDYWSQRWTAQIYAETAGPHRVRVVTDDGARLYVGGVRVLDAMGGAPVERDLTVELVDGWNDLVFDHNEATGFAKARLWLGDGGEPAHGVPAARVRPVIARSERVETAVDSSRIGVPDNGMAESAIALAAPPGAVVTDVDLLAGVDHSRVGDLQLRLIHPDGTVAVLRSNDDSGGNGARFLRYAIPAFAGKPAPGTWRLRVTDTANGHSGAIVDFALAVHYRGGPGPIAEAAAWTSPVRELGDITAIERVRFGARAPAGSAAAIRVRSCDAAARCADEPWSPPVTDGAGEPPQVKPRRFVQYRVELTSEGDRGAELDWVEIDYRTRSM